MIRCLCLAAACGLIAALLIFGGSAGSAAGATTSTSAQFTGTVPFAVSSVTVSPQNGTFGNCTGGSGGTSSTLSLPNGECVTTINVDQSGGGAYLYAAASNATASGNGRGWTLCIPGSTVTSTPACSGDATKAPYSNGVMPGPNQFALLDSTVHGGWLGSDSACLPNGGQQGTEDCISYTAPTVWTPILIGPSQSSDDSAAFDVTITFTVVPG